MIMAKYLFNVQSKFFEQRPGFRPDFAHDALGQAPLARHGFACGHCGRFLVFYHDLCDPFVGVVRPSHRRYHTLTPGV
jgi:hypothetical protein